MPSARLRRHVARLLRHTHFRGRTRVYGLARRLLGDEPVPFTVALRGGGVLTVGAEDWKELYYLGELEADVQRFLRAHCGPGDVVFDVGASIGICTVPLALRVGPAGRVVACEALAGNFRELERNLAQNQLGNVACIFGAVSDGAGELDVPELASGNYSLASAAARRVRIPAATLDQLAQGVEAIQILKLDIEGSETRALRGAQRLFRERRVRHTVLEVNPYWLRHMGSSPEELLGVIADYRLQCHRLAPSGKVHPTTAAAALAASEARGLITLVLRPGPA